MRAGAEVPLNARSQLISVGTDPRTQSIHGVIARVAVLAELLQQPHRLRASQTLLTSGFRIEVGLG